MTVTLDWLGLATFRLVVDDQVIFLDAYMDRGIQSDVYLQGKKPVS